MITVVRIPLNVLTAATRSKPLPREMKAQEDVKKASYLLYKWHSYIHHIPPVNMKVPVLVCVCVCLSVCLYVCVSVCVCLCASMHVCMCI